MPFAFVCLSAICLSGLQGKLGRSSPKPTQPLPHKSEAIKDAIECEGMKVLGKTEGLQLMTQRTGLSSGSWSHGAQLLVQAHQVGDYVVLGFSVAKPTKRHVIVYPTKSSDYGTIRFSVNGKPVKQIDLYSAKTILGGAIDLGEFDLLKGEQTLRAEVVGANPETSGAHCFFGLDCIALRK